jgi:predicted restriction endonuclease
MDLLFKYINVLRKLKRAYQGGGDPHKPILLLAVLDCIKQGKIQTSSIMIFYF